MFQRQYEDDAEVLTDGEVLARGYARLELMLVDDVPQWLGTFRITEPDDAPPLEGARAIRLSDGSMGDAEFAPTEDLQGETAGRANSFFEVRGTGPCPF